MKKLAIFIAVSICCLCVSAQDMLYYNTIDSQPLRASNHTDVQGSPYFGEKNKYYPGEAKLSKTETYKGDIALQFNQFTNELTFQYGGGSPMRFNKKPISFTLFLDGVDGKNHVSFRSGFICDRDLEGKLYYQILVDGKTTLLKRVEKRIQERKGYGEATTKKVFESEIKYFLINNGGQLEKTGSYKDFIKLNAALKAFVEDRKITKNSEENFVAITNYLNTLK